MPSRKIFFVFLLCLVPLALSAQRYISGRITDAEDGVPIPGAAVFIANTTAGTTTDADGNYRLKIPGEGSYRLAVSFVGYQPVFRDIEPGKVSMALDVAMNPYEMEEVTISKTVRFRKRDIDLFWSTLLGRLPSSQTIYAINPEAVYFFYDSRTRILKVSCRVPLQIINNEIGYHIQFVLDYFTHNYNSEITSWEGECMFKELEPENYRQKLSWEKNRKKAYQSSLVCFVKSLYHNSLTKNGFLLTYIGIEDLWGKRSVIAENPKKFLSIDSINDCKTLYIPPGAGDILLVCFGHEIIQSNLSIVGFAQRGRVKWYKVGLFRNAIRTPGDLVYIFSDGTYKNPIQLSPYQSSKSLMGLDMTLPTEYIPNIQKGTTFSDTEADAFSGVNTIDVAAKRFEMQLSVFPQEKVHLHTDKPYYISGERIWFRAHVVDAATHTPELSANCVYVDLFDVRDSIISRVKIGFENDAFSGYIPIPAEVPEGDYTIRAYTNTMRNLDEDYFFMKNIRIGNHLSRMIHVFTEFEFMSNRKISADFRSSSISPISPITPESLTISINSGKPMKVKTNKDGVAGVNFNLPSTEKQRAMLINAIYDRNPYQQYIRIPLPDDDFDVSFYPEGGNALYGCMGRIAFKAMQRDGTEIDVSGVVYDRQGNEITLFKTDVRGMGQFIVTPPGQDETFYAVCTNKKGQSKRFELPIAKEDGYALSATWLKDILTVKVLQPESRKTGDTLYLIVHTRGLVQDIHIWENINEPMTIHKDFFPSGVSNLLLLTKNMVPVSERLVFVYNDDQAKVSCTMDRDVHPTRSLVEYTVNITDESGDPLQGNISVSVTDNHVVAVDTTSNILTSLLLSSDLRGNIPDPAFYFQKNTRSAWVLDLLMLTQGWRRYVTERILLHDFMRPDSLYEKGYEISGTVKDYWERPVGNVSVSLLSLKGDYFGFADTDRNGRFYLHDGEATDSTWFMLQTAPQSGKKNLELTVDKGLFPARTIPVTASGAPNRDFFVKYADKTELQNVDEYGNKIIHLSEVTITARRKPVQRSSYYHTADYSFTLDRRAPSTMNALLLLLPGVVVSESDNGLVAYITRFASSEKDDCSAMFLVDDFPAESVSWLAPSDIAQVDLLTSSTNINAFGDRGKCGIIAIYTKSGYGGGQQKIRKSYYTKSIMPLGFQKPAEFYAPKYDTPAQNTKPDLRTTIHWVPNLTTDENGKASFSFYTADAPSTYSVVIEGVTDDGRIVYKRDRIVVGKEKIDN